MCKIDELPMSTRLRNVLLCAEIDTVEQAEALDWRQFNKIRNVGKKSWNELQRHLKEAKANMDKHALLGMFFLTFKKDENDEKIVSQQGQIMKDLPGGEYFLCDLSGWCLDRDSHSKLMNINELKDAYWFSKEEEMGDWLKGNYSFPNKGESAPAIPPEASFENPLSGSSGKSPAFREEDFKSPKADEKSTSTSSVTPGKKSPGEIDESAQKPLFLIPSNGGVTIQKVPEQVEDIND